MNIQIMMLQNLFLCAFDIFSVFTVAYSCMGLHCPCIQYGIVGVFVCMRMYVCGECVHECVRVYPTWYSLLVL